ncbi:hypothetical protein [Roseomonas sp. CECT 9278]|uniref:hypothetical protein n=1 Tax=Roseomonas sp. CECT 9278 TaxID=2845823 RepID=UPI001E3D251F|nr:hypothetical protein [Roseomonas sp. CECT 9278]CAH0262655.1 hypothetical protein ROS9278_03441 [Roseomonas sp. CECT 9278]
MTSRRSLFLAAAGLAGAPAAQAAATTIALRTGQPHSTIVARTIRGAAGEAFAIAFTGAGAPQGEIRLPTWYGDGRILRSLPIAGREVLLASFQGNRGTGVAQKLAAVIGVDDAGALRILGIETLSFHDAQVSTASRRLEGVIEPRPERDALLLRMSTTGRIRPRPETTERWTTRLSWAGAGVLNAEPTPRDAGEIRHRVDAARAKLAAILAAAPITDATRIDYDETGIWAVGYAQAVT